MRFFFFFSGVFRTIFSYFERKKGEKKYFSEVMDSNTPSSSAGGIGSADTTGARRNSKRPKCIFLFMLFVKIYLYFFFLSCRNFSGIVRACLYVLSAQSLIFNSNFEEEFDHLSSHFADLPN